MAPVTNIMTSDRKLEIKMQKRRDKNCFTIDSLFPNKFNHCKHFVPQYDVSLKFELGKRNYTLLWHNS